MNVLIFVCVIYLQRLGQWKTEVKECKTKIKNIKNKNQNMRGGREKIKKKNKMQKNAISQIHEKKIQNV